MACGLSPEDVAWPPCDEAESTAEAGKECDPSLDWLAAFSAGSSGRLSSADGSSESVVADVPTAAILASSEMAGSMLAIENNPLQHSIRMKRINFLFGELRIEF